MVIYQIIPFIIGLNLPSKFYENSNFKKIIKRNIHKIKKADFNCIH